MKVLMFGWEFPPHISGGLGSGLLWVGKGNGPPQTRPDIRCSQIVGGMKIHWPNL